MGDITINIGMMPEGKKLKSQNNVMVDDPYAEEDNTSVAPEATSPESTTMYMGVDGMIDTKPIPKMGQVLNKRKPEVQLGIE
jgi:hypothetical protein